MQNKWVDYNEERDFDAFQQVSRIYFKDEMDRFDRKSLERMAGMKEREKQHAKNMEKIKAFIHESRMMNQGNNPPRQQPSINIWAVKPRKMSNPPMDFQQTLVGKDSTPINDDQGRAHIHDLVNNLRSLAKNTKPRHQDEEDEQEEGREKKRSCGFRR